MEHTTRTARERRQEREAREIKAEVDAQRAADARRRPIAAKLAETLGVAVAARVRALPIERIATRDARLEGMDTEWRAAVALLESPGCDPDLSETDARAALARCGLIPAGPDRPIVTADAVPTAAGAPESLAGAPVLPSRMCCCGRLAERGSERCAECASDDFLRSFGPYRRCSRCQVRAALLGGLCAECGDAEADDFALECRATTGGATPPGSPVMYDAVIPAGGGDPIYYQSAKQAETVAAALNAYRGATTETVATANAQLRDPNKREVVIDDAQVALYRVRLADGSEHWISPALATSETLRPHEAKLGESATYRAAVPDIEGRAVVVATVPARCRKHAENRARKLFGDRARIL